MNRFWRRVKGGLAAAGLAFFGQSGGALAVGDDVFVVPRVPVQAEAESAAAAKAAAQTQGRRRAMDILLRRITAEEDWIYLPRLAAGEPAPAAEPAPYGAEGADPYAPFDPYAARIPGESYPETPGVAEKQAIVLTDRDLENLESSFEVYGEKSSARTYRAFITYRFKPDAVRRLLREAHLPYSETQMRTALVLPVLQTQNGLYLWEENNPWMAAWKSRPFNNELTPMIAPLGDLEDAARVTPRKALDLDAEALEAMADHYAVSQVIVAHALLRQQNGEDRLTVRLINGYREAAAEAPLSALEEDITGLLEPGEYETVQPGVEELAAKTGDVLAQVALAEPSGNFPTLAERAIESAIAKYAAGWKARTLIDHSSEAVLETSAFFRSLDDWKRIRAGLDATPLVGSAQVFALSPRGAELRLKVFGDPNRLAVALENYGVVFWTEDGERWLLAAASQASQLRGSRLLRRR
ncbi:DUF2066 domain-containing protein [Amphiplicatus metriothermophilus]|uniref:DUF2066 domain-containing protein n=1 Tax=Amphiplicatus metriothermophilus TaxID=1519374 RepID=A0A239PVL6_9PROT|nr:DUF2066 domain-containing protein [Amphiplicatus metriothermophilus]MBB5519594.1 hypothetical protein [Amphiplicatus metriothermophilus]SNT74158.1 hypothetical protein SAMN06297382_2066 [Amphiplicatus metriothermophilus]